MYHALSGPEASSNTTLPILSIFGSEKCHSATGVRSRQLVICQMTALEIHSSRETDRLAEISVPSKPQVEVSELPTPAAVSTRACAEVLRICMC